VEVPRPARDLSRYVDLQRPPGRSTRQASRSRLAGRSAARERAGCSRRRTHSARVAASPAECVCGCSPPGRCGCLPAVTPESKELSSDHWHRFCRRRFA
jgi:hypothetical protein